MSTVDPWQTRAIGRSTPIVYYFRECKRTPTELREGCRAIGFRTLIMGPIWGKQFWKESTSTRHLHTLTENAFEIEKNKTLEHENGTAAINSLSKLTYDTKRYFP